MIPLARRAAIASVATAILLGAAKGWAAWVTGSVAVLASLSDSALDLVASLVTLGAVHWAAQPADAEHRFGHGKAEALAALFQVMLIAASAVFILLQAIARFGQGAAPESGGAGIAVSILAIVATLALTRYQQGVVRRTGSLAIGADRIHYQSDLLLNASVIAALLLEGWLGFVGADPLFGIGIAAWLLHGAWRSAARAIDQLMDREWPEEKRRRFVEVAARHPALDNLHDLRTRTSGAKDFVQFHLALDPGMTVAEAHRVVESVETALARDFPDTDILIHVDPRGQVDEPGNTLAEENEIARLEGSE